MRNWSVICLLLLVGCKTINPPTSLPNYDYSKAGSFLSVPQGELIPVVRSFTAAPSSVVATNICLTNKFGNYVCYSLTFLPIITNIVSYSFNYSGVTNNIVFIVGGTKDFKTWTRLGTVSTTWFTVLKSDYCFFRIAASNTVTHLYSGEYL